MKTIKQDNFDQKHIGPEPTWPDNLTLEETESRVHKAYSWYNYMISTKDRVEHVVDYLSKKEDKVAVRAVPSWIIENSLASLCRMKARGCKFSLSRQDFFDTGLAMVISKGKAVIAEKKAAVKKSTAKVLSVQDHVNKIADDLISLLEDELDNFSEEFQPFDSYNWLKAHDVKPLIAAKIADYYRPQIEELELAATGGDPQVDESYDCYSTDQIELLRDWVKDLVKNCESHGTNVRKMRKPRKKKAQSLDKQVNHLKYQREDTELKLASIDPTQIIGASELWLYNTKYRMLHHYIALDRGGLQVKGTSIKAFEETASVMKKIRKPEAVGTLLDLKTQSKMRKMFDQLPTKAIPCNGRTNEATLILKTSK